MLNLFTNYFSYFYANEKENEKEEVQFDEKNRPICNMQIEDESPDSSEENIKCK